ncbi:hypothetical protein ZYGR_0I00650 [Zygosaccharomyces rouxii]|uniref:ZYRO0C01606p n=2 Tax=Zygosaccharomyces rouxii TaxID=4956 RepID=C5DSN2_ZYGRC|nr:uncharacterized protein ZYRO0C01606g [Zygosaccharomyces rouxii]KAH9202016.1 hypothetical protein LQ764DRAFT_92322 [Zygosaccharomyces rouxii]GAV47769.1 hypothetical protein ZYGR_0I00650 [Zygosaccharomyces rouxii]CAR26793.1 ZYRO0C01606p [Zygosaccharomyces rouxii]
MSLYDTLGVSQDATQVEIKKAYRKLALQHHPDKVTDDSVREESEVRFKEITAAYEVLSDEEKRSKYDTYGDTADGPDFEDESFMNFFTQFNSGFGFNGGGGGGFPGAQPGDDRSDDVQVPLKVSMADCYNGKVFKFQSKRKIVCEKCEGSGWRRRSGGPPPQTNCKSCQGRGYKEQLRRVAPGMVAQQTVSCGMCHGKGKYVSKPTSEKNQCKKCRGQGMIEEAKPLTVSIPRGSRHGDRIVFEGEADQEVGKSKTGDLIFIVDEGTEPPEGVRLERRGYDLITNISISLAEAITGLDRTLTKTLDGRVLKLSTPAGKVISPGKIIKVEQEGWPLNSHATKFGDLYVLVDIVFPRDNWFAEKSDLLKIRNILPSEAANNDVKADPGNTEQVSDMKLVDQLPDYMGSNGDQYAHEGHASGAFPDDGTPQCAQQ